VQPKTLYLIVLLFLLIVPQQQIGAQENLPVRSIKIKGNKSLSRRSIKESLSLKSSNYIERKIFKKEPGIFTWDVFRHDIESLRRLYQKSGYLYVQFEEPVIKYSKNGKMIDLQLFIDEGRPIIIGDVTFTVDSTQSLLTEVPRKIHRQITLSNAARENTIFEDQWIEKDRQLIVEQFNDLGYPYASTDMTLQVDTIQHQVDIRWNINKGKKAYFGSTLITGQSRVPEKSVNKQLTYKTGEAWSKKETNESQKLIYNLNMFSVASVKSLITKEQADTVNMLITLKEAPRFTSRYGVGFGREDRFRAFVDFQYHGFIGGSRTLNFHAKHSSLEPYNIYLKFIQPSFPFPRTTFILHPYIAREDEPGYNVRKVGGNISFLNYINKYFDASLSTFYEQVANDTTNANAVLETPELSAYDKLGFSIVGADNNGLPKLDPLQGYAITINLKNNLPFNKESTPFLKGLSEFKYYFSPVQRYVVASKIVFGFINPNHGNEYVPVDERFYSGGARSVRGWSRSDLGPKDNNNRPTGGNSLLEGSIELRYQLNNLLTAVGYMDGGNVWLPSFTYRLSELHYAAGLGIRVSTPIGPVGVDVARPIFEKRTTWQLHFNIGHPF
jgi:outer membrane protein insertion porin family